jgi:hypothetical protein
MKCLQLWQCRCHYYLTRILDLDLPQNTTLWGDLTCITVLRNWQRLLVCTGSNTMIEKLKVQTSMQLIVVLPHISTWDDRLLWQLHDLPIPVWLSFAVFILHVHGCQYVILDLWPWDLIKWDLYFFLHQCMTACISYKAHHTLLDTSPLFCLVQTTQ